MFLKKKKKIISLSRLSSPINITFFFSCMKHKFFTVLLSSLIILSFQLLLSSHKKKKQSLTIVKLGNLRWKSPGYVWPNKIREVLYLDWALNKPTGFRSKYPRLLSPLCFRVYARPVSLCRREDTTFSLCNLVFQQVILHFFTFFRSTKGKLDDPKKTHLIPQ